MAARNKKDIAFLCQYFYPAYISSATLPYDTAKKLAQNGKSVGVLTGYPNEYLHEEKVPEKEMHEHISIKRIKYLKLNRKSKISRIISFLSFTMAAIFNIAFLREYKNVIVYSNPPILPIVAVLAKKLFKCKIIFVCYDIYPEIALNTNNLKENSLIHKFMNFVNNSLFKNVDKVVALSEDMSQSLLMHRQNISTEQIEIIPNWYEDVDITNIDNPKDDFLKLKNKYRFIVSYLGNMGTAQDINTILLAIQNCNCKDTCFIFAGHGNKVDEVRAFIQNHPDKNVFLFDFLHGDDYKTVLNISDVFITSLAEKLSGLCVPSKTYAYMMAAKPVIAIMDESCELSILLQKNNAGICVENGNHKGLLSYISNLKNDTEKLKTASANSREIYLQNYTTDICTSTYVDLINRM